MQIRTGLMKKLIFLISITALCGLATGNTAALVPTELIQEAGWTHNWQMNLPLKPGEKN